MTDDDLRIEHILNAIGKISDATACTREEFLASVLKRDAVSYNFLVIGEAANRISDAMRSAHPDIPWKVIIGMRNVLIHDYVQTDYKLVWETARNDLPKLRAQLLAAKSSR